MSKKESNPLPPSAPSLSVPVEAANHVMAHLDLLGKRVMDRVTDFTGVVESVSFDLYGCIQIAVKPPAADGEVKPGHWLDVSRLKILDDKPVLPLPDFERGPIAEGLQGPAEKPVILQPTHG